MLLTSTVREPSRLQAPMTTARRATPLDRALRAFTDVRDGEGVTALLLALNIFLILTAYYILKPVREALILGEGSAELKAYLSVVEIALLSVIVPAYGKLVAVLDRRRLINSVTAFFVVCLATFYVLGQIGVPLGVAFFLWISIFNMMIIAQFWSFANDVYSKDEGERLFPIVGFGASVGAMVGARVAGVFIPRVGVLELMLVGAGVLVLEVVLTNYIDYRERERMRMRDHAIPELAATHASSNAFGLVLRTPYLLMIALMLMVHNWVKTTGEYLLGSIVRERAITDLAVTNTADIERVIGSFYSDYFWYVNAVGLLIQLFVVSRIVRHRGLRFAIMILPCISLGAYCLIGALPLLRAVRVAKVAENATDYSLNNTARNMLFLPCTREQKYSAKQAIDSFFVRLGDFCSAGLVFVGAWLSFSTRTFAFVNAVLVLAWLALAWRIGRAYQSLADSHEHP
jgi:AAA family ATP:ADP antiporter